ncbi:MAG: YfhO family protein [Chloroflexi bacterium]|nr:YfhO family protein [Chloroflexota bacterium]
MATGELEARQATLATPGELAWPRASSGTLTRLVRGAISWDLAAIVFLLGCTAFVHWPSVIGQGVYARDDTITFFYPAFATLHQSLRQGELPLWTPHIFGGFPLFAEGQIGALYPPALLAAMLPSPVDGFLLLRVFHVALALVGAYALARCLRISPLGGVVAGLVFGLGSFVVSQQHHASLLAAAVWLPLLLACVELALARWSWSTLAYLALAGAILGMQALASHVQPVLLSGALLLVYAPARALARLRGQAAEKRSWAARVRATCGAALLGVGAVALVSGLAATNSAAQLLPLYELSRESWRANGWSYLDAVEYSLPPINLVTLVLPFFFRAADGGQWSLWQAWEVVLYVGILPLLLVVASLLFVRRWTVAFFAIVAAGSALVSLGGYAPWQLYERLWTLPGVALQRAPARFTFLTTLALAMLAAYGADWLARRADDDGLRRRSRQLLILQLGVLAALAALLGHLVLWRAWLHADQVWATRALTESYLRLSHDPLQALTPLKVYGGLDWALDLANPKTALPLALLGCTALLLLGWREAPHLRPLWQALLVVLIGVDLLLFSVDFHPLVSPDRLADVGGAGDFLVARRGPWRSLTNPDVEAVRPNQLLPAGVGEVQGYSPLALDRQVWYARVVGTVDNTLLDLWGVRYVVSSANPPTLPSYDQVGYHPQRPLMIGGAGTANGRIVLEVPDDPATQLRAILALADGAQIPDGEVVGEWVLTDVTGVRRVVPMRAGREVADWTTGQPGARTAHRPVQGATTISIRETDGSVERPRTVSYAAIRLPVRQVVQRAEYRHIHPLGRSMLYGVALHDSETESLGQFYRPAKYVEVYRDGDTVIHENRAAFPRAFIVPRAVVVPDGVTAMDRLMNGPFEPRREAILESAAPLEGGELAEGSGRAELVHDGTALVTVRTTSNGAGYLVLADAYYPGWRAFVDGEEVALMRANFLFRGISLPAGEHEVAFLFDPESVRLGVVISAAGVTILVLLLVTALVGSSLARRRRRAQIA